MNPKNAKKSPIHESADANITCDFCDGDISRSRSFLSNTYRRERPRPHARTRQSRGLLKFISRFIIIIIVDRVLRGCAKKTKFQKSEITMEVGHGGWQGLTQNFFWENHPKIPLNQYRYFGEVYLMYYVCMHC